MKNQTQAQKLEAIKNALINFHSDFSTAPAWFILVYSIIDFQHSKAIGATAKWSEWKRVERLARSI